MHDASRQRLALEHHQLDRRYEHLRLRRLGVEERLLGSLKSRGQQVPIIVVGGGADPARYRVNEIRYYGYYSKVARARGAPSAGGAEVALESEVPEPGAAERRRLRRSWAQLIRRIYEVDPLTCAACGGEMRIIAFLLDPAVVRKILAHLATPLRAHRAALKGR